MIPPSREPFFLYVTVKSRRIERVSELQQPASNSDRSLLKRIEKRECGASLISASIVVRRVSLDLMLLALF